MQLLGQRAKEPYGKSTMARRHHSFAFTALKAKRHGMNGLTLASRIVQILIIAKVQPVRQSCQKFGGASKQMENLSGQGESTVQKNFIFSRNQKYQLLTTKKNMKITLTADQVAYHLVVCPSKRWTYDGAVTLSCWLHEIENETGEEDELDLVAIRSDFCEYKSAMQAAAAYGWCSSPGEFDHANEDAAMVWLLDRTEARSFVGGVIIRQF